MKHLNMLYVHIGLMYAHVCCVKLIYFLPTAICERLEVAVGSGNVGSPALYCVREIKHFYKDVLLIMS
jgi:hypothetical protein